MKISKRIIVLILLGLILVVALYPTQNPIPNNYIERATGIVKTEKVAGKNWLIWLYNNPIGKATMFTFVKRKFLSSWYGNRMDLPSSTKKIEPFIEEYDIDMTVFKDEVYKSFNDFFYRKLKNNARDVDTSSKVVVSPSDGKILAYADISDSDFIIKGAIFDVSSFLADTNLAKKYNNASLVVVRLAPYDYHRFHFPVSGIVSTPTLIEGNLYSVNPIALKQMIEIFFLNKREYVSISTKNFGDVVMAEVGATMVGSIIQTYQGNKINAGDEKGYFKFGGSTVVLLFEKDKIIIDNDLLQNTANGIETEVKMGEKIAHMK